MKRKTIFISATLAVMILAGAYWAQSLRQPHLPPDIGNGPSADIGQAGSSSTVVDSKRVPDEDAVMFLENTSIEGIDAATLSYIDTAIVGFYKDKNRVYYENVLGEVESEVIEGADPSTFEIVGILELGRRNIGYAKDANHVYAARCGMKACYVDTLLKSRPADCTKDTLAQCEVR